jgi:hypothetical protein
LKDRQIFITTMFALAVALTFAVVAIEIPTMPKAYAAHVEPGCDPGYHMDSDTGECLYIFD